MTAIKLAVIAVVSVVVLTAFYWNGSDNVKAFSTGPPIGYTGAPAESSCSDCHSEFPLNSGPGSVEILGLPHDYKPGQQYTVSVKVSQKEAILYGFEVTAINRLGAQAGTLTVTNSTRTQFEEGQFGPKDLTRQYIFHTLSGVVPQDFGFNTWSFTWTAPAQRIGKIDFYAAGNAADSNGNSNGDYIYTTSSSTLSGSALSNFDGDTASDIAYFRPATGEWFSLNIQTSASQTQTFGAGGDRIVPGDYDGDGKTDLALYRPSTAEWRIQRSTLGFVLTQWGNPGDIPVQGDYDGDGLTDVAVFRPSTGSWVINRSQQGPTTLTLGQSGDKPVQADYDADGKADIGVFSPATGNWTINSSGGGGISAVLGPVAAGDRPVQADYDGDGKADIAIFKPSTATWVIKKSTGGITSVPYGTAVDIPIPADYDGDGKADIAVYNARRKRMAGAWQILQSSTGTTYNLAMGQTRDVPIASGYIAQ